MNKFIQLSLIVILMFLYGHSMAQIGINTQDPDTNSVLDVRSSTKGVKFPELADTALSKPPLSKSGYMIYQPASKKFRFWNSRFWESLNPFNTDNSENITAPKRFRVDGDSLTAPNATVKANNFVGYGTIPVGGIIMWSGNVTEIPDGWALCDGTAQNGHSTPDLRGRFIAGYSGSGDYTSIGVGPGGANHTTLTVDNLPTHSHSITDPGHNHANGGYKYLLQYTGSGTVGSPDNSNGEPDLIYKGEILPSQTGVTVNYTGGVYYPEQSHIDLTGSPDKILSKDNCPAYNNCVINCRGDINCISNNCDDYYNSMCINPDYNSNYGKKIIDSPEHWDVLPFDNRPAYYVLAFIMRVK